MLSPFSRRKLDLSGAEADSGRGLKYPLFTRQGKYFFSIKDNMQQIKVLLLQIIDIILQVFLHAVQNCIKFVLKIYSYR